ncbi:MAG: PAS domain-containing protein [Rubrivivax sp.]|nr:PAS domain-containing protein [Rubrivivax sp.]
MGQVSAVTHPTAKGQRRVDVATGKTATKPRRQRSAAALAHELQMNQAELEAQNQTLRHTQFELAAARDRCVDLYDFAPVAYLTLNETGFVVEANLTAAGLFGRLRPELIGQPFVRFIAPAAAETWQQHLSHALQQTGPQRVELALRRRGGDIPLVQLDSLRSDGTDGQPLLRVTAVDLTQRHLAETTRQVAQTAVLTREAERRRVARELHEDLGQRLSALKMEIAHRGKVLSLPQAAQRTVTLLGTVDQAIATVRRIAADLGPPMLDDLGFNAAIDALVRDTARRSGVHITQRTDEDEPSLGPDASAALYRIVQETLAALVLRSGAREVGLHLHQGRDEYRLTLTHDGVEEAALGNTNATCRGLVHLFGGRIDSGRIDDRASRLDVRLPLLAWPSQSP